MNSLRENHKKIINNKSILKSQQRLRSKKDNVSMKEFIKIALSANDDKRIQYAYGMNNVLVCIKEEIKCNNIIKEYKND